MTNPDSPTPSSGLLPDCRYCKNSGCMACAYCDRKPNHARRAAGEMPKEVANLVYVVREAELAFMEKQMYQEAAGLRSCRKRVESLYPRAGQEEK